MKEDWEDKYNNLLVNFKDLDRYNDVLYRLYFRAKKLKDGNYSKEVIDEVFQAIDDVEVFNNDLAQSRKGE